MRHLALKKGVNTISFLLMFYDIIVVNLSYLMALWLRFDCQYNSIPEKYLTPAFDVMPVHTIVMILVMVLMKLYQSIWRYASLPELVRVFGASLIGAAEIVVVTLLFFIRMPISYYFIG